MSSSKFEVITSEGIEPTLVGLTNFVSSLVVVLHAKDILSKSEVETIINATATVLRNTDDQNAQAAAGFLKDNFSRTILERIK